MAGVSFATTRHLAALFPCYAADTLGERGVFVGWDLSAGGDGWFFDPFELYGQRTGAAAAVTSPNIVVLGVMGSGKSAAVKALLWRQLGLYGPRRSVAVLDPKGEYGPFAEAAGMAVLELSPAGVHRLNPMDPGPGEQAWAPGSRQALLTTLLAMLRGVELDQTAEALAEWAVAWLVGRGEPFTLADVAGVVRDPPAGAFVGHELELVPEVDLDAGRVAVLLALGRLLRGSLAGMFDGPTTVSIDWDRGPGVVLDLHAVFDDEEALPLVMTAASAWLQAAMARTQRRGFMVLDEAWKVLAHERIARWLQGSFKLSRSYGISNVLVSQQASDLGAQAAAGSSASKVADGLLADAQTRILFRQDASQLDVVQDRFGLTFEQAAQLPQLPTGEAIWRVGDKVAHIRHVLSADEFDLVATDAQMAT